MAKKAAMIIEPNCQRHWERDHSPSGSGMAELRTQGPRRACTVLSKDNSCSAPQAPAAGESLAVNHAVYPKALVRLNDAGSRRGDRQN